MFRFSGRLRGRLFVIPILVLIGSVYVAAAADGPGLSLAEVQRLAVERQPLLEGLSAQVAAARERAVSARQLPDPQLKLGVQNLPADSADAWRLNRDSMTQSTVGLAQEFPLAGKRELKSQAEALKAAAGEAELSAVTRGTERDAGLAFLDLLHPHHGALLVQAQIVEAQRALAAAEIAYRDGQRGQGDVLAARAAVAVLEDKAAEYGQTYAAARETLGRWIGPVPADAAPDEPMLPPLPPLVTLLDELSRHPETLAANRDVDRAEVEMRLARKSRQPDFNVELDYAYRGDYSDMVSLQVAIPLPIFAANRQDRDIAAARSELDAQQAMREDLHRRLSAELSSMYREWQSLGTRIDRYQATVLPPLAARVEATLAEYRGGTGTFAAVLDSRQALLDAELALLELHLQRLRAELKLHYFAAGR